MGRGLGMGERVWRWCEYKGVNEREHTAPVHYCHTPHTPSAKEEESTGETQIDCEQGEPLGPG